MKHQSDPRILGQRTLEQDHRGLLALLKPGMRVLDIGCGTGSITAGIAKAVGPTGFVLGIDRDAGLLAHAPTGIPNLRFAQHDIFDFQPPAELYDIATAARLIQWIAPPLPAIQKMRTLIKPKTGRLVVLDYNHAAHSWDPQPRPAFDRFYQAFLAYRDANGWSNQIASEMPELFRAAGLIDIESRDESESSFDRVTELWTHMTESMGPALVKGGFLTEDDRIAARAANQSWQSGEGRAARLELRTITARVS